MSYVRHEPTVRGPLVCAAFIGLFAFNFIVTMPAMIAFVFHAGSKAFGVAEALNAGAAVIGGLVLAPRIRTPTQRRLAFGAALLSLALLGNAVMPTVVLYCVWMPVFGVCFIVYQTAMTSLLQAKADPAFLGRVMSLYTLAIFGTTPVGALAAGWLVDHVSARAAMALGLVATIPCAGWLSTSDRARRSAAPNVHHDDSTSAW